MEQLKNMSLKKAFFLFTFCSLLVSMLFVVLAWKGCDIVSSGFPSGGVAFGPDGTITYLEDPTPQQRRMLSVISYLRIASCILFPVCGLGIAGILFYRVKLKPLIAVLWEGTKRIQNQDLDFSIPEISGDELGQVCAAFEMMRAELLRTNRELWRQTEERKRLNAAFSHDLRNPITVLKGTVKLMQQGVCDEQALTRLKSYTNRIEQYVEAMSSVQRLEQIPVQLREISCNALREELEDTVKQLAPSCILSLQAPEEGTVVIDHGLFLTVAENLIGNAARFAESEISICLEIQKEMLSLTVMDDGPGYPEILIKEGPKPFGKGKEDGAHFGMGLYSSETLCRKHGGTLEVKNRENHGARATANFQINKKA